MRFLLLLFFTSSYKNDKSVDIYIHHFCLHAICRGEKTTRYRLSSALTEMNSTSRPTFKDFIIKYPEVLGQLKIVSEQKKRLVPSN